MRTSTTRPASGFSLRRLLPLLAPSTLCLLLFACAQQGSLTGGPEDVTPPVVVKSQPANLSTGFRGNKIEITFDEYIRLKDLKQLVVSPPMVKKPDYKIKGKTLEITLKDSLKPDITYAINFGDALVDLNKDNPLKNFQFVFSTGTSIDSLQVSGRVLNAIDNKPAEDILVMLYRGTADSLPLKTIPLYLSRTNKEGLFTLRNIAGGSYKIFALKDGNANFLFDQPNEAVAFLDTLITPRVIVPVLADTLPPVKDSLPIKDTLPVNEAAHHKDSLPGKPVYTFFPNNLELRLFTGTKPNQYLSATDRPRKNQFTLTFNEKPDTLDVEFAGQDQDSIPVLLEWLNDPDTIDFWLMNPAIAALDSLTALVTYQGYDSLEQRVAKTDTVKLRYRALSKPPAKTKNEFGVSVQVEKTKTLDFGQPLLFNTTLPCTAIDTSRIMLVSGKDSTSRKVVYSLLPDTLRGLIFNGQPVVQPHPRNFRLSAPFMADTDYRLTLLPGALSGNGLKNDTLDVRFKMKNRDQYGTFKLALPSLTGPAILELVDARNKVAATRLVNGAGKVEFDLIAPGKYTARLIFDTNQNGKWDTGRYATHLQPERVIAFAKEINMKANWEVSETWEWEDL